MARNFGISGVNTPISLSGIKAEFGGPNNFSAYRRLGGFVPANERNFLLREAGDTVNDFQMTQFHPSSQGYSAEYGVAERHYSSRMLCGTGSSYILGGGVNGFEAFRFGDMYPTYTSGMDQIDYVGLTAAGTPKGSTWAQWEAPVQGMSWVYQFDPFYYSGGNYTIYCFYVFADYRASTVGYNWWSSIELYTWTGGSPLSGGTASLATTLTRPDSGTFFGGGLGVTFWIMYEPGINLSLPSAGSQFITKIYVNESAAAPSPPPPVGPPPPSPPSPPDEPPDLCPLCCFTPDTLITLSDMTTKRIDEVVVGDSIVVYNHDLGINTQLNVDELITRVDRVMYEYTFANGVKLKASDDHPIYVVGKGYASINPVAEYKDMGIPKQINVGDVVMMQDGEETQIVSIEPIDYDGTVYTFGISKFYANGVLVY